MTRNLRWSFAIAALLPLLSTAAARAEARFINLSDKDVFIARYTYQPYSSNSNGLAVVTEEGWNFAGWWKVEPGGTYRGPAGNYYVKDSNGAITWSGRSKSPGFVTSAKFDAFVPRGSGWATKEKELLRTGYQKVEFQQFDNGNWTISGNAYTLREKSFDFDFSSRDIKFHDRDFAVPGKVAYISHNGTQWGAKGIAWGQGGQKAWVTLSTEGAQKKPFGPREPGYYRGRVTVYYTERR